MHVQFLECCVLNVHIHFFVLIFCPRFIMRKEKKQNPRKLNRHHESSSLSPFLEAVAAGMVTVSGLTQDDPLGLKPSKQRALGLERA